MLPTQAMFLTKPSNSSRDLVFPPERRRTLGI